MIATTWATRRSQLERQRHVVSVSVATAAVVASLCGWTPSPATAITIVVVAVGVGLPHGALDIVVGPRLGRPVVFFEMYLCVAAATVLVWLLAPVVGLVAFFAASWFHFARGDAAHHHRLGDAGKLLGISTAGCAIGLPLALHGAMVAPVLSDLLLGTASPGAGQVAAVGRMIVLPSIVAGIVAAIAAVQMRRYAALVELVAVALMSGTVHPLIAFALYFSLWHSPRHLITLDIEHTTWTRTAAATGVALITGIVAWSMAEPSSTTMVKGVFIALAALTGPHLVVTELLRSRHSSSATTSPARRRHQLFGRATRVASPLIASPSRE